MRMPSKNIYVAEADLAMFSRAAELAGGLSAAVAAGLRLYLAQRDRDRQEHPMKTITVNLDQGPVTVTKRFQGRQLLRWSRTEGLRVYSARVYLTARGQYAIYTRDDPDWSAVSSGDDADPVWEDPAWNGRWWQRGARELRVFASIESMAGQVPEDLVAAVRAHQDQPEIEDLDI